LCNIHWNFTLNLSFSSIVRTAAPLGNWSNYFDLHNSILESLAIEIPDWCQWRRFSCCPAASVLFVYDVCGIELHTNQAEAFPTKEKLNSPWADSCMKFWRQPQITVLKVSQYVKFITFRALQTANFLPTCSFVWGRRAERCLPHGQHEFSILSLTYRPVLKFTP
jgi:hypothetical protein